MIISKVDNLYGNSAILSNKINFQRSKGMELPLIYERMPRKHKKTTSLIDKIKSLFFDKNKTKLDKSAEFKLAKYGQRWKYEEDIEIQGFPLSGLILVNKLFADKPELLRKIYLQQDDKGKVAAHYAGAFELKEIHRALENQPEVIRRMHLTQNIKGKLPAHKDDAEIIKEINRVFESDPETLEEIYTSGTLRGRLPIHYQTGEGIREIVKNEKNPEILYKFFAVPSLFDANAYQTIREVLNEICENPDMPLKNKFKKLIEYYK